MATQIATFGFSIINARLLSPTEFGIAAVALALISLAGIFTDIGLAAAIVQAKVATERILNTAFWLNVAAGIVVAAIIALAAKPLSDFYDSPDLLPLLLCVAVAFALTGDPCNRRCSNARTATSAWRSSRPPPSPSA